MMLLSQPRSSVVQQVAASILPSEEELQELLDKKESVSEFGIIKQLLPL